MCESYCKIQIFARHRDFLTGRVACCFRLVAFFICNTRVVSTSFGNSGVINQAIWSDQSICIYIEWIFELLIFRQALCCFGC
ncbi:hypothetical protein BT96DRAFT_415715 [Gymnopus androsaceus JB14]|uniref:Uncharacterized protein n=1 Tax=Gymnopus androsaceus JB14 TaxID=1447944 RepID=A0A6A4GU44_9AGAR|nr:hypothetical protein BT96DRAFT_415715 [Gymnopus androsaceus JB14]